MEMSVLIIIFLVLILSIALYYGLFGVDMGAINDDYVMPVAILFLLITTGGFTGNNGLSGDFGLDYCNDKDSSLLLEETEREVIYSNSFFACELGYVDGVVDIGWSISSFGGGGIGMNIETTSQAMILNHENYKRFVNGETYGFSNFYLSEVESSLNSVSYTSVYREKITLHSDTYFFVVNRDYRTNVNEQQTERGLFGPNSPTGSTADPIYFYYEVDVDSEYPDASGIVTTN